MMSSPCNTVSAIALVMGIFLVNDVGAFQNQEIGDASIRTRWLTPTLSSSARKKTTVIFSALSAERPPESSLSGLVSGMLEAQMEIAKETRELENLTMLQSHNPGMPLLGNDGVYCILNEEQLHNFQLAHSDKLVILKFSSPVCKACRALKEKFRHLNQKPYFVGQPVVFADIVLSNNKNFRDPFRDYVTSNLKVQKIPSLQFYSPGTLLESTVGCDPETGCSWSKIKAQMIQFVEEFAPQIHPAVFEGIAVPDCNNKHISDSLEEETTEAICTAVQTTTVQASSTPSLLQSMPSRIRDILLWRREAKGTRH